MAQIATFYAGAMTEAREIELQPVAERVGGLDLVLVGPNDPVAMARHTDECRSRGHPVRRPTPPSSWPPLDGPAIKNLIEGAAYLFTNEYESHMVKEKTGLARRRHRGRGEHPGHHAGQGRGAGPHRGRASRSPSGSPAEVRRADPTGVGDAFRAGFLTGLAAGLAHRECAELGSMLATYVIETVGTQEYVLGTQRVPRPARRGIRGTPALR